jgi:sugar O-acyltransferase (sialic acid O-acetyltransferase NeuD family)
MTISAILIRSALTLNILGRLHVVSQPIFVAGAGGLGREVRSYLQSCGFTFAGFLDDVAGQDVVGPIDAVNPQQGSVLIAVGSVSARADIIRRLKGSVFFSFLHPTSVVAPEAKIGVGVLIGPFCVVGPGAIVGDHAVLNISSTVGHETMVGANCVVSPHVMLSGGSFLGAQSFVGSHATVFQNIEIGIGCVVSAGAAVNKNVPEFSFVAGNPARSIPIQTRL